MKRHWQADKWALPGNRIVVGLTGCAACGKSAVLAEFAALGAETISADSLVAGLLSARGGACRALVRKFGGAILSSDGEPDKKILADKVFKNKASREWLENLLHPMVMTEAGKLIKKSKKTIVVFEVPLLFEAGLGDWFDVTAAVWADAATCAGRAVARGWTKAEFARRSLAQLPAEEKCRLADIVINNNTTMAEMRNGVRVLFRALLKTTRSR